MLYTRLTRNGAPIYIISAGGVNYGWLYYRKCGCWCIARTENAVKEGFCVVKATFTADSPADSRQSWKFCDSGGSRQWTEAPEMKCTTYQSPFGPAI